MFHYVNKIHVIIQTKEKQIFGYGMDKWEMKQSFLHDVVREP